MKYNKDIKKAFFKNIKDELKESREELFKASQNFAELSKTYEVLMVYKNLIDNNDMITLLGYKKPLSVMSNRYKKANLENMNFTDDMKMIFGSNKGMKSVYKNNEVNKSDFYGI